MGLFTDFSQWFALTFIVNAIHWDGLWRDEPPGQSLVKPFSPWVLSEDQTDTNVWWWRGYGMLRCDVSNNTKATIVWSTGDSHEDRVFEYSSIATHRTQGDAFLGSISRDHSLHHDVIHRCRGLPMSREGIHSPPPHHYETLGGYKSVEQPGIKSRTMCGWVCVIHILRSRILLRLYGDIVLRWPMASSFHGFSYWVAPQDDYSERDGDDGCCMKYMKIPEFFQRVEMTKFSGDMSATISINIYCIDTCTKLNEHG